MYQTNTVSDSRKVAIYARVSTEHEEQLNALENQMEWYKPILSQHPEWEVVERYIDKGITGTSAQKRPEFLRMIKDAGNNEFDLILTREVSRFARNTVDTLQYTRKLKTYGVEVFFINDNIKTFDGDGELRLTIMATLAQDESRKTSVRVKSGQQTSMENGVFYGNGNILGYDRKDKSMVINPEQAKTVRMIYDMYLGGLGLRAIKFRLEQAGRLTSAGKTIWYESNIAKILKNTFYCGIITYHKEFTPDFLEQKKIKNCGDIEVTRVEGTHEPIVTEEEFNKVQQIMAGRRNDEVLGIGKRRPVGVKKSSGVWTDIMQCECGHKFNRKIWHRTNDRICYAYQCYSSIKTGTEETRKRKGLSTDGVCKVPMIPEWKLQMMVKKIFKEFLNNTSEIISLAESILEKHINDDAEPNKTETVLNQKSEELSKLNKKLDNLIEMRMDGDISKETFREKQSEISKKIEVINREIESEKLNKTDKTGQNDANYEDKITVLRYYLEQSVDPDSTEDIPNDVIKAFIRKIIVHESSYDWYLRFDDTDPPKSFNVNGRRKNSASVSSLCYPLDRQRSTKVGQSNYIKVQEYSLNLNDAKAYLYSYSTKHRIFHWEDLNISVFL